MYLTTYLQYVTIWNYLSFALKQNCTMNLQHWAKLRNELQVLHKKNHWRIDFSFFLVLLNRQKLKFTSLFKVQVVSREILGKHKLLHQKCKIVIVHFLLHFFVVLFAVLFVALSVCTFYLKFCCIFPWSFICK